MGRVLKSQIEGKHVLPLVRQVVRTQVWMLGALTGPWREEHCQQAQRHGTYQRVLVVSLDYHVAFSMQSYSHCLQGKLGAGGLTDNTSGPSTLRAYTAKGCTVWSPSIAACFAVHLVLRSRAKERGDLISKEKVWDHVNLRMSERGDCRLLLQPFLPSVSSFTKCDPPAGENSVFSKAAPQGNKLLLRVGCMPSSRHQQKRIQWHLWGRVGLVS